MSWRRIARSPVSFDVPSSECSGCVEIDVGSGPVIDKVFPVDEAYVCPTTVDKNNNVGGWNHPDVFTVTRTSNKKGVTIVRSDTGNPKDGWDLHLRFKCCTGGSSSSPSPSPAPPATGQWRSGTTFLSVASPPAIRMPRDLPAQSRLRCIGRSVAPSSESPLSVDVRTDGHSKCYLGQRCAHDSLAHPP